MHLSPRIRQRLHFIARSFTCLPRPSLPRHPFSVASTPIAHRAMASAASASSPTSPSAAELEKQLRSGLHEHARGAHPAYPARTRVPDEQVPWSSPSPNYRPTEFTAPNVLRNSSDPTDPRLIPRLTERASYETNALQLDEQGRPLNPRGRTGLCARGKLYRWGPNHAADPLVTRESEPASGASSSSSASSESESELEVVVIQRGDTQQWALPGGMVDEGEAPFSTARREFGEEALAGHDESSKQRIEQLLDRIFDEARVERVYSGYIDDPRNTDNAVSQAFMFSVRANLIPCAGGRSLFCSLLVPPFARQWLESSVFHSHLDSKLAAELSPLLRAGDDATQVRWLRITHDSEDIDKLYGSHKPIVLLAAARWKEKQKAKQRGAAS